MFLVVRSRASIHEFGRQSKKQARNQIFSVLFRVYKYIARNYHFNREICKMKKKNQIVYCFHSSGCAHATNTERNKCAENKDKIFRADCGKFNAICLSHQWRNILVVRVACVCAACVRKRVCLQLHLIVFFSSNLFIFSFEQNKNIGEQAYVHAYELPFFAWNNRTGGWIDRIRHSARNIVLCSTFRVSCLCHHRRRRLHRHCPTSSIGNWRTMFLF